MLFQQSVYLILLEERGMLNDLRLHEAKLRISHILPSAGELLPVNVLQRHLYLPLRKTLQRWRRILPDLSYFRILNMSKAGAFPSSPAYITEAVPKPSVLADFRSEECGIVVRTCTRPIPASLQASNRPNSPMLPSWILKPFSLTFASFFCNTHSLPHAIPVDYWR